MDLKVHFGAGEARLDLGSLDLRSVAVDMGVGKLQMDLHVGQPMLLINPQNKVEQGCRVVRIEDTAEGDFAVAFEFDKPNPKFWPVVFPPEDWHAPTPDPSQKTAR